MLVNHGPSQQKFKEEYKPWKWGATARYYTSDTKTMFPTRKSMPRSSRTAQRPPDHRKEKLTAVVWSQLLFIRSGKKTSCKAQWKGEEDDADRTGRKTTSGNGQAWKSCPRGQWRAEKNEGSWLWNHLWCPNDPWGWGIGEVRRSRSPKVVWTAKAQWVLLSSCKVWHVTFIVSEKIAMLKFSLSWTITWLASQPA